MSAASDPSTEIFLEASTLPATAVAIGISRSGFVDAKLANA